jgi:putative ABC transport system ATP-binding protein
MTITVKNLKKIYIKNKQPFTAIDQLSLEIPKGDFISIVGPSGCGKSSLLLMLGGMLAPTHGEIFIDNESLYELDTKKRAALRLKKIGFVFQTFHLVPYLSALENVQLPLLVSHHSEQEQRATALSLLERVGLKKWQDHYPSELSVGQQQRIALARMWANRPTIILADEPTGNLDPENTSHILQLLKEWNREGCTLILVTHDHGIAKAANRMLSLSPSGHLS